MSVRLSCPSCNTAFALNAVPDHRRATCPRCGDVFTVRTYTELPDEGTAEASQPAQTGHAPRPWPLPLVAGAAVALGLLGLAIGLLVQYARDTPKSDPQPDAPPALIATPPSRLAALGFLRADCNVVFAVQPGPLLHYSARTKQEPRDVLAQAGLPDVVRSTVEQFGVPLAQIDHIAGGVGLGDGADTLRLALVLVLKQPLADEDGFLKALKAKPAAGKKPRHDVVVGKFPLLLARVAPTVWVFGLDEPDFDAVDDRAPPGARFRAGVRTMIAAVPPEAAVWVAADDDRDWTQKPIVKLVGQSADAKKWLPAVKDGRGGLVAVSFTEQPRLRLYVRAAGDDTGARVRAYFAERATEVESATAGGGGAFALFDAPFDGASSGKLLQRFLTDAGRP